MIATQEVPADKNYTKIRWTHAAGKQGRTWNPIRGCSVVSPGCTNCYAMSIAARFSGPGLPFEGFAEKRNGHAVWTGKVAVLWDKIEEPLHWRKPALVFVNSMADLFHADVPDAALDAIFDVMEQCPQHTFQILTKRPERMRDYMREYATKKCGMRLPVEYSDYLRRFVPSNCWLGTSVEDQRRADERIPFLLDTPAAVRFLSCEPLLGPIDLHEWLWKVCPRCDGQGSIAVPGGGNACPQCLDSKQGEGWQESDISWTIVGGESGPRFRPMDLKWARSLRDQCVNADVPYFFKQSSGLHTETGQTLDGVRWEQYPAFDEEES